MLLILPLVLVLVETSRLKKRSSDRLGRWTDHRIIQVPFYFDETHTEAEKRKIRRIIGQLNNWIDCAYVFEVDRTSFGKSGSLFVWNNFWNNQSRYGNSQGKKRAATAMRIAKPPKKSTSCSNDFLSGQQNLLLGDRCLQHGHNLKREIIRSLYSRFQYLAKNKV